MMRKFWFNQAIAILTKSIENLVYAYVENTLDEKEIKVINSKVRELSELIPSWDESFKKRNQ